jgi:hypothetical protein
MTARKSVVWHDPPGVYVPGRRTTQPRPNGWVLVTFALFTSVTSSHDVRFSDPPIRAAFARLGQILFTPGYVFDRGQIATVPFICNFIPMLGLPPDLFGADCAAVPPISTVPACWLHRQGPFATFFGADAGADFFPFPGFDPSSPAAQIGGGSVAIMVRDTPENLSRPRLARPAALAPERARRPPVASGCPRGETGSPTGDNREGVSPRNFTSATWVHTLLFAPEEVTP